MKSNTAQFKTAQKYLGDGCRKCCSMSNNCCCSFVGKIFRESDNAKLFFDGHRVTYCPTAILWCRANLAQIPPYIAMQSDIIFFDWQPNGTPDHIGFVRDRVSDTEIATLEGNTTSNYVVAYRTRTAKYVQGIFRPHFPAKYDISKPLAIDGKFEYSSIAMLQKVLKIKVDGILGKDTVKAMQKKLGVAQDGSWGVKTTKALQSFLKKEGYYKGKIDGCVYVETVKAFQKWINANSGIKAVAKPTTTVKPTVSTTPTPKPTPKPSTAPTVVKKNPTSGMKLPSLRVKYSAEQVISNAIKWGKAIAKDNAFHYGHGSDAHHNGCYFCGTQPKSKKNSGIVDWQKTYCCNPFVHACYAHGGLVLAMLSMCQKGKSYGFSKNEGYAKSNLFKKVSKIKAGDVLCSGSHVALYIGDGKVVQAGHSDDNKKGSKSWNSSISVGEWNGWTRAYRFVGKVDADINIMFGEMSDRVVLIQKFLNSYFKKQVVATDGLFGDYTKKYVKKYQEAKGLKADGIIGAKTLASMRKDAK